MVQRGEIRNREYATQIRDFTKLRYKNITPTDIDGFTEFGGKLMIFIEAKHNGAPLPFGQRLAFERLCDAVQRGGIHCFYFVVSHNCDGDVDYSETTVVEYRWMGQWRKPEGNPKLSECWFKAIKKYLEGDYTN